jgi:DNA-binding transcriptional LysR family regulator
VHIPWEGVELVVAIAETGSLSAAARRLELTQPTVSRRLAELEARLGEPLFVRAVEGTSPTPFGERLLEPARRMAECAGEVAHAAKDADPTPRGVVRLSAAPGMAHTFAAPFAAVLRAELPAIRLELQTTTRYVDLVRREADLALRWQSTARRDRQRDLEVVAEVAHPVAVFASAAYAASLPAHPTLADLAWIAWCAPFEQLPPNPQLAARIPGFVPAFASDDFLVQLRAAEAGAGAIVLSRIRYPRAPSPLLVELPIDLGLPPTATHVVASRSALAVPRVRAVADRLARELASTVPRSGRSPRRRHER